MSNVRINPVKCLCGLVPSVRINEDIMYPEPRYQIFCGHCSIKTELSPDLELLQDDWASLCKPKDESLTDLHPSIIALADIMQEKLNTNKNKDGKGWERSSDGSRDGWSGCDIEFLKTKLMEEVSELFDAIYYDQFDEEDVHKEAADVANLAMMLADAYSPLSKRKSMR